MKILFQGDSITDANRNRNGEFYFGSYGIGYPNMIAAKLLSENPEKYSIVNLGISGNRVVDLYARWHKDCFNIAPDLISILIGVNDVWHEFGSGNGVPVPRFEKVLRMLIEETREELPGVKFMLLEPFVTHGAAVDANFVYFKADVLAHAAVVKRVAEEMNIPFVPLQSAFDQAEKDAPAAYWTMDGVHPTEAGHALIADKWLQCFNKNFAE